MRRYTIAILPKAMRMMERLPEHEFLRIKEQIDKLSENLVGDVKKLRNFSPAYRLRVGDYRVLFDIVGNAVVIHAVGHRRDIYG